MEKLLEKAMEELRKKGSLNNSFDFQVDSPVVIIVDNRNCLHFESYEDLAKCLVVTATEEAYCEELFEIFSTKVPTDRQLWEFIKSGKVNEQRVLNEMPTVLEWWAIYDCDTWGVI